VKNKKSTLVIQWPRFGPYHISRIKATATLFHTHNIKVIGLETACSDETYQWREESGSYNFERYVAFPEGYPEKIDLMEGWFRFRELLSNIRPDVIAVNGYSSRDSQALVGWCKLNHCPAILMFESKFDDYSRTAWKEFGKRLIVSQYKAGLCGGKLQRSYLEQLGMKSIRIFEGYDVVDNDYFYKEAIYVRDNPGEFNYLPGLESTSPFFLASSRFIRRKNIHRLLEAYGEYREHCKSVKIYPFRLVILGDGEERMKLEGIIIDRSIESVTLAGFRQINELPAYYGQARLFIHPALQDQWGLVVNEAMASGLPVIVSRRCGCVPDLVREGVNGFTFDPENINELVNLMVLCSSGTLDLSIMGDSSYSHICNWGLERFAEGMYQAFKVALN